MPGFVVKASLAAVPDGIEATLEGVTAAQDENAKEVDIELTPGQSKVLNFTAKRVVGSGGHDLIVTSSVAPWMDGLSQSQFADADLVNGVAGTWTIQVPSDATAATIPALTIAMNEAA